MGKNSKIIFCGDYTQTDLTRENDKRGIVNFMNILKHIEEFETVEFMIDDIVRSDFLKSYIIAKYKMGYA
jgi:phosphate starvation-inducible protein PhoH